MADKTYADPEHEYNSAIYHSGIACIESGCDRPAGTAWSPLWCQACNAKRLERVSANLSYGLSRLTPKD